MKLKKLLAVLLFSLPVVIIAHCDPPQECDYPPGVDCDIRPYCCV